MAKKLKTVSPLDSHLGYWLRSVSNQVSHAFKLKVEAQGVTVAEWVTLRALYDESEIAPSALADALGLTRGAISKLVDRLVIKDLVRCTASQEDRRYQAVGLTTAGRQLVPKLAALADANDAEFFGSLSASQRTTLLKLLRTIQGERGLRTTAPID